MIFVLLGHGPLVGQMSISLIRTVGLFVELVCWYLLSKHMNCVEQIWILFNPPHSYIVAPPFNSIVLTSPFPFAFVLSHHRRSFVKGSIEHGVANFP